MLHDPLDEKWFRLRFIAEESRCSNAYAPHVRTLIPMAECIYGLLMANLVHLGGMGAAPKWLQNRVRRSDLPSNMVAAMLDHLNSKWLELLGSALPAAQRDFEAWRIESGRPLVRTGSETADLLILNTKSKSARFNGARHALTERQAAVLKLLIESKGGYVTGPELKVHPGSDEKPHKIISAIRSKMGPAIIIGKPNAGFVLTVPGKIVEE